MTMIKDKPSFDEMQRILKNAKFGRSCAFFHEVGSTNTYIKRASAVLDNGFVAVSGMQAGGRGRLGKSFESPNGGLYMSLLVKDLEGDDIPEATVKTAVSVCEAIEEFCNLEKETLMIKWVNDILFNGKKLCGILCELVKCGNENCLIIGIGLNIAPISKKVSPDIRKISCSLSETSCEENEKLESSNVREALCAAILIKLEHYLYLDLSSCIETYRDRSIIVGRDIYVIKGKEKLPAHAYGITDDAKLCVHYADGHFEMLYSGDVSIKTAD